MRRSRRGVSPIIATILLVAITVALAATLYILLLPLIAHNSATPLSPDSLAYGTVNTQTGIAGNPACAVHDYCWQIQITTASNGVAPSSLLIYVQGTSGLTISNASWTFTFLTGTNSVAASAPGPEAGSSGPGWTGSGTGNAITLAMYLWIDTGGTTGFPGQTVTMYTVGTNGFSGTITTSLPT